MKSHIIDDRYKSQVLLLFGGESSEHEVSLASASNVYMAIDKERFDIILGYIDTKGRWYLANEISSTSQPNESKQLIPVLGSRSFKVSSGGRTISPDVLLPILHGKNGEDGSVQALGQLLHIPVVGCDMAASAICMDKVATKEILSANHIPNVPYKTHRNGEAEPNYKTLTEELGSPLFVKPARAGSSIGVSKVTTGKQFTKAMRTAHKHDAVVLIERTITGRELETAVLGNPPHHRVSGVGEIIAGGEFYSYDAKYSAESTSQTIVPAALENSTAEQIRSLARRAYTALGCQGMARVDFFLDETGKAYLNEVNTIPGFTNISMYPKLWKQERLPYTELITQLISLAIGATMRAV